MSKTQWNFQREIISPIQRAEVKRQEARDNANASKSQY